MLFNEKTNPNCLVFDADGHLIPFPITGDTATGIVSCLPLIDDENAIGPLNGLPVLMVFKAPLFIVPRHTAKPWTGYTFAKGDILMIAPCPKCGWMIEGASPEKHLETCEGEKEANWPKLWFDLTHLILGMIFILQREGDISKVEGDSDASHELAKRIEIMRRLPFNMKPWGREFLKTRTQGE